MKEYIDKELFLSSMGLTGDETKYGNRDAEHQSRSYSTYMAYEILDSVDDAIAADVVERKRGELGEKAKDAFGSIAWYNGHCEWLCNLADQIEAKEDGFFNDPPEMDWLTDRHALWMMLVGMFGDWGTSIRSGWIVDKEAAVAFIREATQEYRDALDEEVDHA